MKRACRFLGLVIFAASVFAAGRSKKEHRLFSTLKDAETVAQLKHFVAEKQSQGNAATNAAAPEFATFCAAAKTGDWLAVSNAFVDFRSHAGQYENSVKTDGHLHGPRAGRR